MKNALLSLFFIVFSFSGSAAVNPDNGNFHVKNTDFLVLTQGINIEVSRTYNSRSSYIRGAFGVGWSSEMEGSLDLKGDQIVYLEAGGGNAVVFKKASAKLWKSSSAGNQSIEGSKEGYRLNSTNGRSYFFNKAGRLARLSDNTGNFVEYSYSKGGQIELIKDNFNNQVKLKYQAFGGFPRVVLIERNEFKARFEYDGLGNLKKAVGMDAVPYAYEYDDQYNLTKVTYQDGTYKELSYNKIRDWVKKYRDIDGMVTEYDYFSDSLDPENKFGTAIKQYKEGTKEIEEARFWYEFRRKDSGERYKYRSVSIMRIPNPDEYYLNNGKIPEDTPYTVNETFYTACCSTPLSIATWEQPAKYKFPSESNSIVWADTKEKKRITKFDYYSSGDFQGFLRSKTLPNGMNFSVKYEKTHKKISELTRGKQVIGYSYDDEGSPVAISDSLSKKLFNISYGTKGEITLVQEQALKSKKKLRTVLFRYNGDGQAVEIKEKLASGDAGSIQVVYSPSGRVSQVLNAKGRIIASQSERERARRISETFTMLVELLRPVGLSFGPEG
ncbi:RHS repeat protein [bacterium]|nr:RHS repeat protein [bacterium]